MKRRLVATVAVAVAPGLLLPGCTHDWSLPIAGGDAGPDVAGVADGATSGLDGGDASREDGGRLDCAGSLLCDTFDGPPLAATWDDISVAPGGTAAIEPFAGARSAPNVFAAYRPMQDVGASATYAGKVLRQPLKRVRMELDVLPSEVDPDSYATVAAIVFDHQGAGEHKIRLAIRQRSAQLQELGPSTVLASHDLPGPLPVGAWTRVAIEVEAGGNVRASVGGVVAFDVAAARSWQPSSRTLVLVGINFVADPHGNVRVRIDDVRVDGS